MPEAERSWWEARWEIKQATCPKCQRPRELCTDPDSTWYPQRSICYATREREAAEAKYAALHEKRPYHDGTYESWAEKRTDDHPYHYSDGVTIWVAEQDVNPDDKFLDPPDIS